MATIDGVSLDNLSSEHLANAVLYRLARALRYDTDESGTITADLDELVSEAERFIAIGQGWVE